MSQTLTDVEALVADRDEWKRQAEERGHWLNHATETIAGVWSALGIARADPGGPGLVERVKAMVAQLASITNLKDTRGSMAIAKPTDSELEDRFRFHPIPPGPEGEDRQARHTAVTEGAIAFAKILRDNCEEGRQLSIALTDLEGVRMRGNASIAGVK